MGKHDDSRKKRTLFSQFRITMVHVEPMYQHSKHFEIQWKSLISEKDLEDIPFYLRFTWQNPGPHYHVTTSQDPQFHFAVFNFKNLDPPPPPALHMTDTVIRLCFVLDPSSQWNCSLLKVYKCLLMCIRCLWKIYQEHFLLPILNQKQPFEILKRS